MEEVQKTAFQEACCFSKMQQVAALNLTLVTLEGLLAAQCFIPGEGTTTTDKRTYLLQNLEPESPPQETVPLKVNFLDEHRDSET